MAEENIILKTIVRFLKPDQVESSLRKVDFNYIKKMGKTNIIMDLDETLIPRSMNDISPDVYTFISQLKYNGFKICLTSNNRHPLRLEYIGRTLGVPAIPLAFKPLPFGYNKAMRLMGSNNRNTVVIGDQILTDILGGKILNIYSIYVHPISPETFLPRVWMRELEERIFKLAA